jgi:transcriptional regulator with XRE-family HTH domain
MASKGKEASATPVKAGTKKATKAPAAAKSAAKARGAAVGTKAAQAPAAPAGMSLGQRIRNLRRDRDWSLNQLAQICEIAPSTLSKVENDILTLNYDRLSAVAAAFGMSLSEFLAEPRSQAAGPRPVMARRSRFQHDTGEIVSTPNYEYRYQCTDLVAKGLVPIFVVVKARSLDEFGPMLHHEGEELVFVIKGQVTVHTEYYKPEVLGPLQGMYIDSTMGHAYVNSGEGEAWMFSVNTSTKPASTLAGRRGD